MNGINLTHLLARLVDGVPHARSAVLLSTDGMAKFWHGLSPEKAETLAAIASGQRSMAQQASNLFFDGGGMRQVACEVDGGIMLVTSASEGSALAVLAGAAVDTGILSYEMAHLARQVPEHLATAPRAVGGQFPGAGMPA